MADNTTEMACPEVRIPLTTYSVPGTSTSHAACEDEFQRILDLSQVISVFFTWKTNKKKLVVRFLSVLVIFPEPDEKLLLQVRIYEHEKVQVWFSIATAVSITWYRYKSKTHSAARTFFFRRTSYSQAAYDTWIAPTTGFMQPNIGSLLRGTKSARIPYVGRIPQGIINYRDVFLGESSFYFVLEYNFRFSGRSHQYPRKCNNRLDLKNLTKLVLHFRTEWYRRIPICPEM